MVNLLRDSGHDVIFAAGFEAAIRALADHLPDLLISQVRLGAFNGLHLVIRSHIDHLTMHAIVLDSVHDSVLELEAQRYGAAYLVEPVAAPELLAEVSRTAQGQPRARNLSNQGTCGHSRPDFTQATKTCFD